MLDQVNFKQLPLLNPVCFERIIQELERRPLEVNNYRAKAGAGRSQAFGVVKKRCLPPDYSRQCWRRPYLYKLLLDFGRAYVTDISWNAITVNQNYSAGPHYDKGNEGPSYLVSFGHHENGNLTVWKEDLSGSIVVKHQPVIGDFSVTLHSVQPWTGTRYSLVYYKLKDIPPGLPPPSVELIDGKWRFKRGDQVIHPRKGLPGHPISLFHQRKKAQVDG
jgi:hypothetical protein